MPRATHSNPWGLTAPEVRVLRALAAGATFGGVAAAVCRSERTIENHAANCRQKMEARNTTHAVVMFDRWERAGAAALLDQTRPPALLMEDGKVLPLAGQWGCQLVWSPKLGWQEWRDGVERAPVGVLIHTRVLQPGEAVAALAAGAAKRAQVAL